MPEIVRSVRVSDRVNAVEGVGVPAMVVIREIAKNKEKMLVVA